jgi:hypothetical protein
MAFGDLAHDCHVERMDKKTEVLVFLYRRMPYLRLPFKASYKSPTGMTHLADNA